MAFAAPTALRSMHGIWTSPPTGSHVSPRLCSMPISAAFSTCSGAPPMTSASPAAAMEQGHPLHRPQRVGVVAVRLQLRVERGGTPADLEATGKHARSVGPALDAL